MNPVTELTLRTIAGGGGIFVQWINPTDATYDHVRILRVAGAGPITGPNDAQATVILNGKGLIVSDFRPIYKPDPVLLDGQARQILDTAVVPAQAYTYAVYASNLDEMDVSVGSAAAATAPDLALLSEVDVLLVLIGYLEAGLTRALVSKVLVIPKKMQDKFSGRISVVKAPPRIDQPSWPVVSVHLDDDGASDYVLGDVMASYDLSEGYALSHLGYLSVQSISIGGWALDNQDVRHSLYRTLKGLLMGGRQLLTECGVIKMELSGSHKEDFQSYDMPMYSAEFHLRVWVASRVDHPRGAVIEDIDVLSAVSQTAVC